MDIVGDTEKRPINWSAWVVVTLFAIHIVTMHTPDELQMNITNNLELIFGL